MEKEIKFTLKLDENYLPEKIEWTATEDKGLEKDVVKALMIAVWDDKEKLAKKVDLWTKDMYVEDMKMMYFQTFMTMADGFERATGESLQAKEIRQFAENFGKAIGVLR